ALDTNPLLARFQPVPHKVDLSAAVAGVKDNITLTAAIGGFLGAAAGLVGGCLLGAVAAGVVSAPAVLLFGAGPLAGCIGGALLLGSGASLAG
ncbi:spore germination protein, partial [Streptomyces sp. SID10244]|nr:spore germination protein [Streptomyces sp. SID10244]